MPQIIRSASRSSGMVEASQSTFSEEVLPEGCVISARGAVGREGLAPLHECLDDAVRNSDADVTVDLCEVSFLDAAALHLLHRVSRRLTRQARRLSIVCPPGPGLELFGLSGLHRLLTIYPTRETARGADRSRRWERHPLSRADGGAPPRSSLGGAL